MRLQIAVSYVLLVTCTAWAEETTPTPQQLTPPTPPLIHGFRPSIWSKTVQHIRSGRRHFPGYAAYYAPKSTEVRAIPLSATPPPADDETQILQSSTVATLRDFANQLVNETVAMFKSIPEGRSYSTTGHASEDMSQQQTQQLWDDKDQSYHASSYSGLDYEPPTSYHQPFHSAPPPMHYYPSPPQKKDDLFTKVALIALLKLVLAKLKAIGLVKFLLILLLKVPLFFFKLLIVFKGFKFLKLLSIPFLIAAFALPFLPLIPFFLFSFIPFLLLIPLALPLLLPLLMFLPLIPVTTPPTAPPTGLQGRKRRDVTIPESVTANQTWTILDEQWKGGNRTQKAFKTRQRPSSARFSNSRYESFLNDENSESLLELTQRVVQSQQCMERAACELAAYNDSKIYQTAIIWALGKLQNYAPAPMQRRIEQYARAYEKGSNRRSTDVCSEKFRCLRPKLYLVQGSHSFNLI